MKRDRNSTAAAVQKPGEPPAHGRTFTIKKSRTEDLLRRLKAPAPPALVPVNASDVAESSVAPSSIEAQMNQALGCKTSEVALAILAQVVQLEQVDIWSASEDRIDDLLQTAHATLAELEPENATQTLLAAQMVGAQRLAMSFLASARRDGQTVQAVDAHILRATRLMRLFNEQVETMARLKGKNGQQRVVVEHVTVTAGGQAIVGVVDRGSGGSDVAER